MMDATVDDFFNEINEIAPPKPKQKECFWKECYDELTGYSYYWNTKTDEVTWDTPAEFKSVKAQKKEKSSPKKRELYIPPRAAPSLPVAKVKLGDSPSKIYSIGENSKRNVPENSKRSVPEDSKRNVPKKRPERLKLQRRRPFNRDSESDDEKIELISSYGEESESETDEPKQKISKNDNDKSVNDSNVSDEDDDLDILTKIQKRAKELKELGGDLPPEVTKIVSEPTVEVIAPPALTKEKKQAIAGFSLVAGYSDSEEEPENEEVKAIFSPTPEAPKVSHSTLFPIMKPIDVKDFMQPPPPEKPPSPNSDFDSKMFQRKRRIGVALVNTAKKKDEAAEDPENQRKGFGFGSQDSNVNAKDNVYAGFKKGGVMFVKSDVLNPASNKGEEEKRDEESDVKREDVESMYITLQEKLGFLSRPKVSPVQVMVIQAETLFSAMKDGGLKLSYLRKWLEDTCSELIKLEKEAAPEGWLLQWDRSHKRYYYQNQTTGEGQWEYPQLDINRCDEAMDISTTPPPTEPTIHMSPPLPPSIRSPTPPPAPIISVPAEVAAASMIPDVPLPPEPSPAPKFTDNGEPLPPGVDLPEIVSYKPKEKEQKPADPLFKALDSFYSDIAAIETTNKISSPPAPPIQEETKPMEDAIELPKKKKKVKLSKCRRLGLSKKRGVSQLVEKWKTVQQHYND